jgi:hypothetical protein
MIAARVLVVLSFALVAAGCASGVSGGKKYTKFRPADAVAPAQHIEPARHSGEHFIVVRMVGTEGLARLPHTTRQLRKGDRVGFARDERGQLLAVAGNATRPLEPVPAGVSYIAWYYQKDQPLFELGRSIRDGAAHVGGIAAEAAVVGAFAIGESALEDALNGDDDDDDEGPMSWLNAQDGHKHHRKHKSKSRPTTAPSRGS